MRGRYRGVSRDGAILQTFFESKAQVRNDLPYFAQK